MDTQSPYTAGKVLYFTSGEYDSYDMCGNMYIILKDIPKEKLEEIRKIVNKKGAKYRKQYYAAPEKVVTNYDIHMDFIQSLENDGFLKKIESEELYLGSDSYQIGIGF